MLHNDEMLIPLKVLMKRLIDCEEVCYVSLSPNEAWDRNEKIVYLLQVKVSLEEEPVKIVRLNIWLYFYDNDNVMIQQVFSDVEYEIHSINANNESDMRLHFEPVNHNVTEEEEMYYYYEGRLAENDW